MPILLPPEHRWLIQTPIAHRGLHEGSTIPENSLAAFLNAAKHGYAAELDAQLLADGAVVVFHDNDLQRLTGQPGPLARETARSLKSRRLLGTDQCIPLLPEVMDAVRGQIPLLIEIKNETPRVGPLESAIARLLSQYSGPAAVMSFNPLTVAYFRRHSPRIPRGQLSGLFGGPIPNAIKLWLARMPLNGWTRPDFAACDIDLIGGATDTTLRAAGLPVLAWTVTPLAQRDRAAVYADNIIFEKLSPPDVTKPAKPPLAVDSRPAMPLDT